MTMPLGLGIDGDILFLCDDGLKVYDVSDVQNIVLLNHFDISAFDVIPLGEILLVVADDGLYQYKYSGDEIEFVSKLETCGSNVIP